MRIEKLSVVITSPRAEWGAGAAAQASARLKRAIAANGGARVILSSAPSQNELLEGLIASEVDWSCVTIFHMDEYIGLPSNHPATFRTYQRNHVLSHITPAVFHGIQGEAADSIAECARYSALLRQAPIDLVCLGIGENGHLAFNDPPVADFDDPEWVKPVELDALCRQQQVNDGCFPNLDSVPTKALTLTIPALLSAPSILRVH